MATKICPNCKESKNYADFNVKRNKEGNVIGLRSYCKQCSHLARQNWRKHNPSDNERNKQYNKAHAEEIRGKKLVLNYWPHLDWRQAIKQWDALFAKQDGKCAICKKEKKRLHVDHCHETREVRGLLCYNCNNGLGRFKDNLDYLSNAIQYLKNRSA